MKKTKLIIVASICMIFTNDVLAQKAASECDCAQVLKNSIREIAINYSLFNIKVNEKNKANYEAYNQLYLKRAANIDKVALCQDLMNNWKRFFRDGHLNIRVNKPKVDLKNLAIDLEAYKERWKNHLIKKDSIEGLWNLFGSTIAIVPDKIKGKFSGVTITSPEKVFTRGMVRADFIKKNNTYFTDFYVQDSSVYKMEFKLKNLYNAIASDGSEMSKIEPINPNEKMTKIKLKDDYAPDIKWLDNETALFTLPTCNPFYAKMVDSLVNANKDQLSRSTSLIIDLRNNSGGSDRTYRALLPYILTKPITLNKVGYLLTPRNLAVHKKNGVFSYFNPADTLVMNKIIKTTEDSTSSAIHYEKNPINVAIIANKNTASSGETFIIKAKMSPRVITYGEVTAGVVDGFNSNSYQISGATLRYPTALRHTLLPLNAIDPFGILPDIPISNDEKDPIAFIVEHLKELKR